MRTDNKNYQRTLIFIPGGPGISGTYWDYFIQNFLVREIDSIHAIRLALPNHEQFYNSGPGLDFDSSSSSLAQNINNVLTVGPISIVAHSYGALLILNMILQNMLDIEIESVILVGMPTRTDLSDEFQSMKAELNISNNLNSNKSFTNYFKKLFPLYTEDGKWFYFFESSFWIGNEEMAFTEEGLRSILGTNVLKMLHFIDGDDDIIVEKYEIKKEFPIFKNCKYHLMTNAQHFPMLEKPNQLLSLLKEII